MKTKIYTHSYPQGEWTKKVSKTHSKLKIAKTKKLEKGWIGKSFACYQLAKQSSSEWIIFIDADTEVKDDLNQLINYSLENKLSDSILESLRLITGYSLDLAILTFSILISFVKFALITMLLSLITLS